MIQPRPPHGKLTAVLAAPIPLLLRAAHPRRLRRAIPWPVLSLAAVAVLLVVSTVLLSLPLTAQQGGGTAVADAAFTAVSAVTVTGLTVVDTAQHWDRAGQGVILGLIQLGGLGIMTFTTFLLVMAGFRIGIRGRALAREDLASPGLSSVRRFVRSIALFALTMEAAGFGLLLLHFRGHGAGDQALWQAGFHAVSAFNNAGFDLMGPQGFTLLSGNAYVVLVVAGLIVIGGISFPVVANIVSVRGWRRLLLNSKIVLVGTVLLLAAGTAFILGAEYANPDTLGPMPWGHKLLNAFFSSVTSRTAGFSTVATARLLDASLLFLVLLMFVGAAAGSAGGGVKVNSFGVLVSAVSSALRGRKGNEAFGRRIPDEQLRKALTVVSLALTLIIAAAMVLGATDGFRFVQSLFLVVSAFATVGLSPVDTGQLTLAAKVLIMVLMLAGKLGLPLLVLLLARLDRPSLYDYPEERVNLT